MENIIVSDINKEMKERYIDYAMSVIVDRALPDVRDGLKPVHRRIVYAMNELKLYPEKGYRKCARIVGDVLGKYHPHGDISVYDALVRMAQDFNMRYMLVDGHGNYGSVDGDGSASMRYTEAKMEKLTMELIRDIEKNTIKFIPNFDGEELEPTVLPSRFPNLLANGSEGIAVGMSTKIPSHNLNELIDGIIYLLDNEHCTIKDLVNYIPAPDFPTGGEIINPQDMISVYENGSGTIILKGKHHFEKDDKFKRIVFTEIPYQQNKSKICNSLVDVILEKSDNILKNITDVRDESDRDGMRIVIEFKQSQDENKMLSQLLKKTNLQINYGAIFRALVNGQPMILNLKQILDYYIEYQKDIITKRTIFDLNKVEARLHILDGLMKALNDVDNVIKLIRQQKTKAMSKQVIMDYLSLDEKQATYIIEIQLYKLASMEIDNFRDEFNELTNESIVLNDILNNQNSLINVLKKELLEIKDNFGDERRSKIIYDFDIKDISKEDLVEDNTVTICLTKDGYIKKNSKYSENQNLKEGDEILQLHQTTNKSSLLLFTNQGRMFVRKVYELEDKLPSNLGEYLSNILDLNQDEKVIYICTTKDYSGSICFVYENGNIAKTKLSAYQPKNNRQKAIDAYNTESKLVGIGLAEKDVDILLISDNGKGSIIDSSRIKSKSSRAIQGNCGIKLDDECKVIKAIVNPNKELNFTMITEKGKEKVYYLDDVAETAQVEKSWYSHLRGNGTIKGGNFIYNTRAKNDKIIDIVINK